MFDSQDFFSSEKISPPKDTETPVKLPIIVSPSSSVGSSSLVRSTTSPPDYPFDELSKWSWTSTSAAPAMNQAVIRQLIGDRVAAALEAQADNMENTDNSNRNPEQAPAARKLLSHSNYTEDCKVKFATGTLTKEALLWWNSFAQPIGIEEAYKITWFEFKKLLIKKFQELATLCPTMVSDSKKLLEAFIRGLPRSIKGNVTASKPQTLEEAINIAQRLMDQVTKHNHVQETNDHKRKLDDKRNTNNNNYPNNSDHNLYPNDHNNNNHSINRNNYNYHDNRNNNNVTITTTGNKMEGRKPLGLIETMDIIDPIPYVGSVHCIIQDLALSGVRIVTK
nr:hypothetical protein [Tanacetum cinerariifolium]